MMHNKSSIEQLQVTRAGLLRHALLKELNDLSLSDLKPNLKARIYKKVVFRDFDGKIKQLK